MLTVKPVDNKKEWETFLLHQPCTPFFQSWNWGEVQERIGNKILRLGIRSENKLVGICLVVEIDARRGHYYHLRHGPVLVNFKKQLDSILAEIKKLAIVSGCSFIRMSPLIPSHSGLSRIDTEPGDSGLADARQNDVDIQFLKQRSFIDSPIHNMDAENAWVLDLNRNEEELLANMRKTTRYLIKRGKKSGLVVIKGKDKKDISSFLKLYNKTAIKHGFVPHQGIEEELEVFGKDDEAVLFLCRYKKRVISGAVVIFYGQSAVYHHGATDEKFERFSPSYLVQWEAIKEAKRRGKKLYNFWGVVPPDKPNHPWQGLTLFKTGFGGRPQNFLHSQDLPLSLWYWKTYIVEYFTKIIKGY